MEHPILKHMNTGMSRYSVEKGPHAKHGDAPHRNSSPANNVSYGDISGKTGYIGEQRADDMKYNPVDDRAGMSRQKYGGNKGDEKRSAKKDYDGMSRYGGNKGDIKRSAKKDY